MAMRAYALSGLLLATLGTSCATIVRARQRARPAPSFECLRAALAASPDVVEMAREFRGKGYMSEGFEVVLADSTAEDGRRLASIARDSPDRPGQLHMGFSWRGVKRPPAVEERAAAGLAARLLRHLQTTCAPGETAPALCDRGDGKWKPCAPAG